MRTVFVSSSSHPPRLRTALPRKHSSASSLASGTACPVACVHARCADEKRVVETDGSPPCRSMTLLVCQRTFLSPFLDVLPFVRRPDRLTSGTRTPALKAYAASCLDWMLRLDTRSSTGQLPTCRSTISSSLSHLSHCRHWSRPQRQHSHPRIEQLRRRVR